MTDTRTLSGSITSIWAFVRRKLILSAIALSCLGLLLTNLPYQWLTVRTIDAVRIKDKQISTETDKETQKVISTYLIYTDQGVFRNDDAGWHFKYNSSDFYGNLDVGKTYRLTVYGWRIPVFSMYPNIVDMDEVNLRDAPSSAPH